MRVFADIKRDIKILYAVSVLLLCVLLLAFFLPIGQSKMALAAILALCAVAVLFLIKKRGTPSINSRQVLGLMSLTAVLYLMLYYLSGIKFGFVSFSSRGLWSNLFLSIIPIAVIIIAIEIIRSILVAQQRGIISLIGALCSIVAYVYITADISAVASFNGFMDLLGMSLLPAITWEILYHYLSKNYGAYPNIIFRLIVVLYAYILPIEPAMPDAMKAFLRLATPILIFIFIRALYEKRSSITSRRSRVGAIAGSAVGAIVMISIVMLISCQFKYGLVVIGSESMTGEINKGDAIIYESYEDQKITEGQVIVFTKNNTRVIHRVVEIKTINGENRYYTKGDANETNDIGYITDADIIGTVGLKVSYIGYPTVWLRDLFN